MNIIEPNEYKIWAKVSQSLIENLIKWLMFLTIKSLSPSTKAFLINIGNSVFCNSGWSFKKVSLNSCSEAGNNNEESLNSI